MTSRKEILELLGQGKITADEAANLLAGAANAETAVPPKSEIKIEIEEEPVVKKAATGNEPSWFKVRVRNMETGKNKVSVNIPVRMLKFGMKIGKKFTSELDELNWDDINGMVSDMQTGMLVEVQDEDSNEHVQVYLE
ncbi:MAG: hypothetical protein GY943_39045 [Chloroflexi bacterium]|nr:hypothetical protein [Chloroflexota bacterium]